MQTPTSPTTPSNPTTPPVAGSTPAPSSEPRRSEFESVTFVAYPKLLFAWPLILLGFLFWPLAGILSENPAALAWMGWIYLFVAVFIIMALGVDVDRNQAFFWLVLLGAIWLLGVVLKDRAGITIFGDIYKFFAAQHVVYNRGFGLSLSIVLSVPFLIMVGWAYLNDRWRITHNEFEHYSFGRMDDSLGRGAKTIRTEFPDVFELILGLAGTLIVYNATGNQVLRRIPHVMFLPSVRKRLNRVLEKTAVIDASRIEDDEG